MAEDVVLRDPYRRQSTIIGIVFVEGSYTTVSSLTQAILELYFQCHPTNFLSVVGAEGLQLYIKKIMEPSLYFFATF